MTDTPEAKSATAPPPLIVNGVTVEDTFAEAFPMTATRVIITAAKANWAMVAANLFTGNATSVIACDLETSVERILQPESTHDGRPGISVLAFGFSRDKLAAAVASRVGQCVLTCPTTACFNGIEDCPADRRIRIGGQLRFFGDGFQSSKLIGNRRYWRIPTMDGEFLCEDHFGTVKGVAGGNLLIGGPDQATALTAAEWGVMATRGSADVIMPFPGGIVRSGSKVGSKRYKALKATTNDAYCPTLRTVTESALPANCQAVYEIVFDGLSLAAVETAMGRALAAVLQAPGVNWITAGNYGGKLGPHHIYLRTLLDQTSRMA